MSIYQQSVDNSRLETYDACPQLYDYKYNLELDPGESNLAARFSTHMVHIPVQRWYESNGVYRPDWEERFKAWNPSQEELLAQRHNDYSAAAADRLFDEYITRFSGDLEDYDFECAECYYTKDLDPDNTIPSWGAKLDMLLKRKSDDMIIPFEFKSSRYDYILIGLPFNRQVLGQIYVTHSEKCVVNYFGLNSRDFRKNDYRISRFEVEPTPEELERWRKETSQEVWNMEVSRIEGVYPRKSHSCKRFNKECAFLELCLGSKSYDAFDKTDSLEYLKESVE